MKDSTNTSSNEIGNIVKEDLPYLKKVIDTSGLFPSEMLDDMVASYFTDPNTEEIWLTKRQNGKAISIAYCAPERLTDGTYNLYLIAVRRDLQGMGIGKEMMTHIEQMLAAKGNRVLLVETSGLPDFEATRKFYDKCGYQREALIRDFYREGEDKVVFWKKLDRNTA